MDEDNNIRQRDEMLSLFRESLSHPVSERYFDEDQLLDIFDYAGDVGDDYIRMEVLMCAARFYPDSEQLLQRKAIFYNQYSDDTIQHYLEDNPQVSGLIWDILKARLDMPAIPEDRSKLLSEIADRYEYFNDEEVVQFVDLISSFGAVQWAKDNIDRLSSKVDNINMLLYETAIMADNNQDKELSIAMLEELTEREPFNQYYWFFLAKQYGSADDNDKALNAIDYALAISPDDINSLLFKAKLLYMMERPLKDIEPLLQKATTEYPDNTEAIKLLAALYNEKGEGALGLQLLEAHLNAHPDYALDIVPELLLHHPDNVQDLLDKFYTANSDNSQILWISWAHHLTQNDEPELADEVIRAYERNSGNKIYALFTIESLFCREMFEDAINAINDYLEGNDAETDFSTIVYMHLISMLRLGQYTKALAFCLFLESKADILRFGEISSRLQFIGMMEIVRQVKARLSEIDDTTDWLAYDPLKIWTKKEPDTSDDA